MYFGLRLWLYVCLRLWTCNCLRLWIGGGAGMVLGTNPSGEDGDKTIPAAGMGIALKDGDGDGDGNSNTRPTPPRLHSYYMR